MDEQIAKLIDNYQPTEASVEIVKRVPKVFLVGIAAAGKNTILKKVLESDKYYELVTYTTRPLRSNNGLAEKNGGEYNFVSKERAIEMLQNHEFVEAKWIHRQNLYGTVANEFQQAGDAGKVAIADIDVHGVEEYMKLAPDTTKSIFILPPDFDTWQQRFKSRYEGRLGEGEFQNRMFTAAQEIEHVLSKHYYAIVINDDLDDVVEQIQSIADGEQQSDFAWQRGSRVAHELLDAMRSSTH
ncbi:MAG: hypothetical protein Q7T74_03810 [Candidatus Saccharibacteria bacterium]|nr:hypothetical protein [Candidatus Saccharibacteria bacterium]